MPALLLLLYRLAKSIRAGLKEPEFRGLFWLVVMVVAAGTWFYRAQEGWAWLDSLYFTIITLTTVGYGDFSPKTPAGKVFTIVYILVGLSIISSFIVLLAEHQQTGRPKILRKFASQKEDDAPLP